MEKLLQCCNIPIPLACHHFVEFQILYFYLPPIPRQMHHVLYFNLVIYQWACLLSCNSADWSLYSLPSTFPSSTFPPNSHSNTVSANTITFSHISPTPPPALIFVVKYLDVLAVPCPYLTESVLCAHIL